MWFCCQSADAVEGGHFTIMNENFQEHCGWDLCGKERCCDCLFESIEEYVHIKDDPIVEWVDSSDDEDEILGLTDFENGGDDEEGNDEAEMFLITDSEYPDDKEDRCDLQNWDFKEEENDEDLPDTMVGDGESDVAKIDEEFDNEEESEEYEDRKKNYCVDDGDSEYEEMVDKKRARKSAPEIVKQEMVVVDYRDNEESEHEEMGPKRRKMTAQLRPVQNKPVLKKRVSKKRTSKKSAQNKAAKNRVARKRPRKAA